MVTSENFKRRRALSGAQITILTLALIVAAFAGGVLTGISVIGGDTLEAARENTSEVERMRRLYCGDDLVPFGETQAIVDYAKQHNITCGGGL